ncbi:MAG: MFS transporter [Solirubrobacterales bacterium]|nr:MFS transporter [Solirubrobacterales bacterium]
MDPITVTTTASRQTGPAGARLSQRWAFGAVAAIFVCFTAASAVPTPLYVVYQEAWGFSPTALTFVFAIYVVGLLGALLVVGALSDHIGRRPVLAGAIALEIVSLIFFVTAGDLATLSIARFLQGIATGAALTTLGACLVDLNPSHAPGRAGLVSGVAPLGGLAIGAIGCGALVQYAPAPTHLVYALLLGGMALAAVIVVFMPETSTRRPGARESLIPRVGVPERIRPQVFAIVPILAASWALAGIYLSLGPSVAASVFGIQSHLVGGIVVTLLCGTGAFTAYRLRDWPIVRTLNFAPPPLAVGLVITLIGVEANLPLLAAGGTIVAAVGFGAAALGTFGTLANIALPDERGELFAVAFVISYVSFAVPAVIAGYASSTSFGLKSTTLVYGAGVLGLSLVAMFAQRRISRRAATAGIA